MKNVQDRTMASGVSNGSDPVVEYTYLNGKDLNDGVFAWISFGIDKSKDRRVMASAQCSAEWCKSSGMFKMLAGLFGRGAPKGTAPKASGAAGRGAGVV
jgi:hypothetical protein